jgi:ribonucleoside-diphosphate reductase alpha chain
MTTLNLSEIMRDLEVKRASLLSDDEKPRANWGVCVKDVAPLEGDVWILEPDSAVPFSAVKVAQIVGEALTNVLFAQGAREVETTENCGFVRGVTERVMARIGAIGENREKKIEVRLSDYDLSVLIEAVLIERGAFDVAKALVMQRAQYAQGAKIGQHGVHGAIRLIRRNGQVVPWNPDKIEVAVRKAFLSRQLESDPALQISQRVARRAEELSQAYIAIETVQDFVQEELVLGGHMKVAESYILYRAQRALLRAEEAGEGGKPDAQFSMISVLDEDGTPNFWDGEDLRKRIQFAMIGLDLNLSSGEIEAELRRSIRQDIKKSDLQKTIILNAKTLMERDADFGLFAGRILLSYIYEETLQWDIVKDGVSGLAAAHQKAFKAYVPYGVEIERLSPDLLAYDIEKLAAALDPSSDLDFDYLGLQTLYDRYLITDKTKGRTVRLEAPQLFWMRVAMGLFKTEGDQKEDRAIELYTMYKNRRFCSSTPTLFNSGTLHSQLSSCYLYKVDDSIESIMIRGIAENAFLSKWAGGLGGSWTSVRGTGGYIQGTNGESQGVIPFLKMHNDQLVAVNQGGKRAGSGCAYLESWHNDIFDFLELRKNTGDERRRTHDMNTANWIPDLFMKRMEARENWTLFRANETPDLHELYGKAFETRYAEYEQQASEGKIYGKKVEAITLWREMLKMIFETGHPWITFKDPCNVRSPQDHVGVIHSSNLCCVTGDQRAVTHKGILRVADLAKEGTINRVPGRSKIETATQMFMTIPNSPVVEVQTKEGYRHKVTPDHPLWVVGRGWVEAQHLQTGDRIEVQQIPGIWGTEHRPDEAFLCGMIAGDGTFDSKRTMVFVDLWEKDAALAGEIEEKANRLIQNALDNGTERIVTTGTATPKFTHNAKHERYRMASAYLARILGNLGFTRETKLQVPEFVWRGDKETVAAYLRGLFLTDGTLQAGDKSVTTMSLASRHENLLEDVQILLANFGVRSTINKMRGKGVHLLPDGKGGHGLYNVQPLYRLLITSIQACQIVEEITGFAHYRGHEAFLNNLQKVGYAQKMWATVSAVAPMPNEDVYCLTVDSEEHAWVCNGLVTKNTEITLNTSDEETAVCNLGSVIIDNHLDKDGNIDHVKLKETIRIAVRALDNVIDINFYPTKPAETSNSRHRPIGMGVMGLQYALYKKNIPFASEAGVDFNDEMMEAICYYAYEASSDLAKEKGTYSSYKGSKWDRGLLPPDTIDLLEEERGLPINVTRGGKMDWTPLREKIRTQGMRNSNVIAIAPTATIANIMGTSPCIEPLYKNLYVKSNLSGDFVLLNPFLVKDLKKRGLWDTQMIEQLKYFDGDLQNVENVPEEVKEEYRTAFQIEFTYLIDAAARRQKWIDQSQSVNLFLPTPDMKALSHMYRHAWHTGLKTTYYLRTLGASNIEKATVSLKKRETEPVGEGVIAVASNVPNLSAPIAETAEETANRVFSEEEKLACSIEAMRNGEECEACQ